MWLNFSEYLSSSNLPPVCKRVPASIQTSCSFRKMTETFFPPSPNWFLPNIIAARKDGSVAYGSKNSIVILKAQPNDKPELLIISKAHSCRVTGVSFSPPNCSESIQNTLASCSDDGYVKLWKIDTLESTIGHKCHSEQKGESGKIISLDWSIANPHYVVSAAENNSLVLWNTLSNSTIKFSFQILGPTVISCCPYNEKVVAVGGKAGQIYIISLTGNGDILYRLRGHDNKINSLSWCPVPYNVFKDSDVFEEFLLASACQNKEVFIWRAGSDGKCESKFQIPTSALSKRDGVQHGKVGNSFSYVALCWLEPYKIYTSSNFGELIYFDLKLHLSNKMSNSGSSNQKSNKQNFVRLGHCYHTKGLFAIAGAPLEGEVIMYKNASIHSNLKFPLLVNNFHVTKKIENQCDGIAVWDAVMKGTTSLLWTAGQDRKIVACELKSSKMNIVFNYNTLNANVHSIVVSPHDPNKLAIGVGDGMIRLWNLTEPCGEIQVYWQKIKDRVMSLDWHPTKDGLLAYGTSAGRVGLLDTKSNKLPSVFKPSHPQPVYNLSWGPKFPVENSNNSESNLEFDLYSVGDNTLFLHNPSKLNSDPLNLSEIISFPCDKQTDVRWKPDYSLMAVGNEDGSICLVEPSEHKILCTILAYKKLIHSLAWHSNSTSTDLGLSLYHGYLTSASTDNSCEIKVFNCKEEAGEVNAEQVATLKGHQDQILSVCWCPHTSCRLLSAGSDGFVRIWDVISQTSLFSFCFNSSGIPLLCMWSPIHPDFILTGCKKNVLCLWRISTGAAVSPPSSRKTKKTKNKIKNNLKLSTSEELSRGEAETPVKRKDENGIIPAAETKTKYPAESKMFPDIWKRKGKDELKNCYSLLKTDKENNEENYSLAFFGSEDCIKDAVKSEEEAYIKENKVTELGELALWNGNLKEFLQERIASGQLNEFFVSLAPLISPKVWQDACLSYSKTLARKKFYRKAASYLIVCHKIYDAIQLLVDADLYREAIFIARTRLPKLDPMLEKIVRKYAEKLFKDGLFLKACECYVYLGEYLEVARVCGKSKQPEFLSLAALAAKKCGYQELEISEATNALFKCFETNNFELAQRICNDHDNLRHLGLIFFVYRTLHQLEVGELEVTTNILSYVRDSFNAENVIFPSFLPKLFHRHNSYKNKRQMHIIVAQELSFAACTENMEEILTHLIKALSTCHRYDSGSENEIHPLYKLCQWLTPEGFLTKNSFFTLSGSELSCKVKSLRSYLCAAIVTHLHNNENVEVVKYIEVLRELKDDLLDPECYKYYKNRMSLDVCEKEVLKIRSRLPSRSCENRKISEMSEVDTQTVEDSKNGEESKVETVNGTGSLDLEKNSTGKRETENEESFEMPVENGTVVETENETILVDTLKKKLELMKLLKSEIENFENERISSPHPFPVCAWLKKLCERYPENKTANLLLLDLEEKWFQMN